MIAQFILIVAVVRLAAERENAFWGEKELSDSRRNSGEEVAFDRVCKADSVCGENMPNLKREREQGAGGVFESDGLTRWPGFNFFCFES